ncbi:MAG: MFS transporter [Thermoleophilaceae bacterium]|nr:MFS transporter [Thermoleophilaceae bacterium]
MNSTSQVASATTTSKTTESKSALAILAICGSAFLVFLDTTIVNISFPSIGREFSSAGISELVWVLDAYFVALAAAIVPAGLWADRLGRKRMFVAGVIVFLIASVACGLAPSWQTLVGARVLQALGGAVMVATSLALILQLFPTDKRATAVGLWGAAAAVAAATGPPLGGFLVDSGSWRWIFFVNIPIGLFVLFGARQLVESRDESATGRPDVLGAVEVALALGIAALALTRVPDWGWGSAAFITCCAAALALTAHVWVRSKDHPEPVFDHEMVATRSFAWGTAGTALFATSFFAILLANVLFLTTIWGYSEVQAGLAILPSPIMSAIVAAPAGVLADRIGPRWVIFSGTVLYAAGVLINRTAGAEPDYLTHFLPGMLLIGAGIGLAFPTLSAAALEEVPDTRFATASSLNSAMRQVGAVFGTALLVAMLGSKVPTLGDFQDAYLIGVVGSLAAGLCALSLGAAPVRLARLIGDPG